MDHDTVVRALLALSGVEPPEDEVQGYITGYPAARASVAALYTVDGLAPADGILVFRSGDT